MGIINAILGNARGIDTETLQKEYEAILCEDETIEQAFAVIRDKWVFTDKRLIIQDTQGVTGHKRDYHSIPYRSVVRFSIETAGTLDEDTEMKIWVRGMAGPIEQSFSRKTDIKAIQRALAKHVL